MVMINGMTNKYAILGYPIGHSFSPVMQNMFFDSLGLNCVYLPFEVAKGHLEAAVQGLHVLGFKGANVTIPHKEGVLPYLVGLSDQAQLIGAINTLIRKEDGFWGENTDGQGLLRSLEVEMGWQARGKKVAILGAGGSAKAVAVNLALAKAEHLIIINRTLAKAKAIAEVTDGEIGVSTSTYHWGASGLEKIISDTDIIINTTPLGMKPNINAMPPIDVSYLSQGQLVVDLIYNPLETKLLRVAKEQGYQVCNGLGMLIYQGILAFKHWTGQEPRIEGVREKLERYLVNEWNSEKDKDKDSD